MKINVFSFVSSLHKEDKINEDTKELLFNLERELDTKINLTNLDELYNGDLALILIQSGGSEGEFIKHFKKLKEPYYLLTYGSNNSLAASLEILSFLKDQNLNAEVLHGSVPYIANRIKNLINNDNIPHTRYGVIGKPSDWLIASKVDYDTALKHLNVELIDIDLQEVIDAYNCTEAVEVDEKFEYNEEELKSALKLYQVLKNIKAKYNLNGLTIRCFDLLTTIKTTACLALSLFNKDNIVGTCEGDIPTMMSMHLLNYLFSQPGFQANPSRISVENKTIILAHCTLPLNMVTNYTLDTHFESGIGVAIRGKLKEEKVTIFKFSRDLKNYYVTTGTIIKNLNENNLCRSQIEVKIDDNIEYFLNRPYGNHHVVIYGDHKQKIIDFLNNM